MPAAMSVVMSRISRSTVDCNSTTFRSLRSLSDTKCFVPEHGRVDALWLLLKGLLNRLIDDFHSV